MSDDPISASRIKIESAEQLTRHSLIIYALIDPRTGEVKYIGKSTTGYRRIQAHLVPTQLEANTPKIRWIKELLNIGLVPQARVLLIVADKADLSTEERRLIAEHRATGYALTNATDGGDGLSGRKFTPEHRAKISQALRGRSRPRWIIEAMSAARRGRHHSEETKLKISKGGIGRKRPPKSAEAILHMSEAQRGKKASAETRAKLSAMRLGRKQSLEVRLSRAARKSSGSFVDQDGIRYESPFQAGILLKLHRTSVCAVLKGKLRQTGGYTFKYL